MTIEEYEQEIVRLEDELSGLWTDYKSLEDEIKDYKRDNTSMKGALEVIKEITINHV